jgi:peptidoglycan-N-acetylglucosamine deacetylase
MKYTNLKILTFDVEEWYHILDNESTKTVKQWDNYEIRIHENVERILTLLEKKNQKATFFCLGWIAKKFPEIVRVIDRSGNEIGTHTMMHQLVYEQNKQEFKKDLQESIKTIQDITGKEVKYFRAPGFSIREDSSWAFDIIAESGIKVDCSIFPTNRAHGGFPSYTSPSPSIILYKGKEIKEFPINYVNILGKQVVFSGGGYFRLFPYWLIKMWTDDSGYVMSYLHPRDFDSEQPVIKGLSTFRYFKAYVGLSGAIDKLDKWIDEFRFVDLKSALELVDWATVPVVRVE